MKYKKKCDHCRQEITAYTHNLNQPMAEAFCQMVKFYLDHRRGANLDKDLNLTKNQFANFQKLRYFGLTINTDNGWVPTQKGMQFYRGEISILRTVATMNNAVLPRDHEAWSSHKAPLMTIRIDQLLPTHFKQREEYQAEKSSQMALFS